jgi:hypothetical protein
LIQVTKLNERAHRPFEVQEGKKHDKLVPPMAVIAKVNEHVVPHKHGSNKPEQQKEESKIETEEDQHQLHADRVREEFLCEDEIINGVVRSIKSYAD